MPEYTPLTREERACLVDAARKAAGQFPAPFAPETVLLYEATVKDRDERNAALEAELARLRPLAATGEAVNNLPRGKALLHTANIMSTVFGGAEWAVIEARSMVMIGGANEGDTALAALRAAKGEGDA